MFITASSLKKTTIKAIKILPIETWTKNQRLEKSDQTNRLNLAMLACRLAHFFGAISSTTRVEVDSCCRKYNR